MQQGKVTVFIFLQALVQLIRLPNVLIIILTQFLLRYGVLKPLLYSDAAGSFTGLADFTILVLVTVLIAAGGYVINDYFDVKIDQVNRPERLVVNRVISPLAAIITHMVISGIAIVLGFYLAWRVKSISFGLIFPLISGVLWIYSAKYKRVIFWGNFIVAALSGFVILIVWLFEFFHLRLNPVDFVVVLPEIRLVTYVFLGYACFAFFVTMVREIVKDLEDAEGDKTAGCETLPIVIGAKRTIYIAGGLMVFTIIMLAFAQFILFQLNLTSLFWYFLFTVQAGAILFLVRLFSAREKRDYRFLSLLCKLIMVAGILSMGIMLIIN